MSRARIYTRTGDDGTTGLLFGGRVRKDDPQPTAYGSVDEAQAALGMARALSRAAAGSGTVLDELLIRLERDLWVLMAELATHEDHRDRLTAGSTQVDEAMVGRLEQLIDEISARFEPPSEFVVPGEEPVSAALDVARTVVRRAERDALRAAAPGSQAVVYLNRLSDLLWTLARWQEGTSRPTRERGSDAPPTSPSRGA